MQTDSEKLTHALTIGDKLTELITFDVDVAKCHELAEMYIPLTVEKDGLPAVYEARQTVKNIRVAIDNRKKELKRPLIDAGKYVESEAKKLTSLLRPIEANLQAQEDIAKKEKERLAAIEKERRDAELRSRLDALQAVGLLVHPADVAMWTDEYFEEQIQAATEKRNAEAAAEFDRQRMIAAEEERQQAERERLAEKTAAYEADIAKLKAEADRLQAERDALAAEKDAEAQRVADEYLAKEREEESRRHAAEAAAQARIDTELRIKREAAEAEEAARLAEQKRLRREARQPWREKLAAFADLLENTDIPSGRGCKAMKLDVDIAIAVCVRTIREIIQEENKE